MPDLWPSSLWVTSVGFLIDRLRRCWPANFKAEHSQDHIALRTTQVWSFQTCLHALRPWMGMILISFFHGNITQICGIRHPSFALCQSDACMQLRRRRLYPILTEKALVLCCWLRLNGSMAAVERHESRDGLSKLHSLQTHETSLAHPRTIRTMNPLVSFPEKKQLPGSPTWMVILMIFQGEMTILYI